MRKRRGIAWAMALGALALALVVGAAYVLGDGGPAYTKTESEPGKPAKAAALKKKNAALRKRLAQLAPKGTYVVVDTSKNRLFLMKGGKAIREAVVSSGSGNVLQEPNGTRRWVFDTPRGEFTIRTKQTDPVWIKPDWAFIEEGEAPPKGLTGRIEEGVLGDYAMGFGDGYFIHGTLYTRLLGYNVTHGCVRVGDEDIEAVYKSVPLGTKLYIF